MLKLAVIGDPVAHSASPALHRGFLAEAGVAGTYEAIRVAAGDGARAIDELRAAGYTGLNVTTPLKEEAYARADERDAIALATGAVNTLLLGPRIRGYNTDGIGTLGALAAAGLADVAGRRILVLGAGPTARAAVAALVAAGAHVALWNRTREKAFEATQTLGATLWENDPHDVVDAVVATLSPGAAIDDAGLHRMVAETRIVIDANYADRSTLAQTLGREVTTGFAMLEASARASFDLFRSVVLS